MVEVTRGKCCMAVVLKYSLVGGSPVCVSTRRHKLPLGTMSFDTKQRRPVTIVPWSSGETRSVSSISGQRYLTMSMVTFSHVGHWKVRLSWPGPSGSIRSSHIVAPHFGQVGRRRTRRAGSKDSHSDIAADSRLKWRARRRQQTTRQTQSLPER